MVGRCGGKLECQASPNLYGVTWGEGLRAGGRLVRATAALAGTRQCAVCKM